MSVTWRGPSGGEGLSEVKNKKKVNIYLMGYEAFAWRGVNIHLVCGQTMGQSNNLYITK